MTINLIKCEFVTLTYCAGLVSDLTIPYCGKKKKKDNRGMLIKESNKTTKKSRNTRDQNKQ